MKTRIRLANCPTAIAVCMMLSGGSALAQGSDEPCGELTKSGTFVATSKNIGLLAGIRWGRGTITMTDGKIVNFNFKGLKALETGVAVNDAEGEIYNLTTPEDLIGVFYGSSSSVKLVKGPGEVVMNNSKCVVVKAKSTGEGLQLSAPAPSGVYVQLAD